MNLFVLDASVVLGWFVDYPTPPLALRAKRLLAQGARALVPAIWHLEVANGLSVAEKRGVLASADVDRCLADVELVLSTAIETRADLVMVNHAAAYSRAFGLSPYDAVYLHLARVEAVPIATLDGKLRTAAERFGLRAVR